MSVKTTAVTVRLIEDFDLHLEVSRPSWLFARTSKVVGKLGMHVYKSVAVRENDAMYAPVADFLRRCRSEVITNETVEDESMMFGLAEWQFRLIHRRDSTARGEDLDPSFLEEMRREGTELFRELLQGRQRA